MFWFITGIRKKYAQFNGRAGRTEFWQFTFFYCLFACVALVFDHSLGLEFHNRYYAGIITASYIAILVCPFAAVCVRRLHDTSQSGSFIILALLPLIGTIWLIDLFLSESDEFDNRYGPNPKETFIIKK